MTDELLRQLASQAGLLITWEDAHGRPREVAVPTLQAVLTRLGFAVASRAQLQDSLARAASASQDDSALRVIACDQRTDLTGLAPPGAPYLLTDDNDQTLGGYLDDQAHLPAGLPPGYYRLHCGTHEGTLAVAPVAQGGAAHPARWGLIAQCYSLRRAEDGGLGDTGALADLIDSAAAHGADVVLSSPLHACDTDTRECSPYSPSDRRLYNLFHAAPDRVLGEALLHEALADTGLAGQWAAQSRHSLINWPMVRHMRERVLRQLHQRFRDSQHALLADFRRYVASAGTALRQFSCFEALREQQGGDWRTWPASLQAPDTGAVQRLCAAFPQSVDFHLFCQWLTEQSLAQVRRRAGEAGMAIGLMTDLAVGSDPAGCQAWATRPHFLEGLTIGAPPDLLNPEGQNWGLTSFTPDGLRQQGYQGFIDMLRASLKHAGGLRVDHVMGLQRLWVVPEGSSARDGVYLRYPREELIRLLALEAHRHRALMIGEDLGTVPDGLRELMTHHGILGTRVLFFEQQRGTLPPAECWTSQVMATTTTHDLPTTRGWFNSRDIEWRYQAGQRSLYQAQCDQASRQREAARLQQSLQHACPGANPDVPVLDEAIRYLGGSRAPLVLIPLEDVMGATEQPNLPGAGALHPNWRRRWHAPATCMLSAPAVTARLAGLNDARRAVRREDDDA